MPRDLTVRVHSIADDGLPDMDAPPHPAPPTLHFVVHPGGGGLMLVTADRDRAHEFARNASIVVAELPIVADYRRNVTP